MHRRHQEPIAKDGFLSLKGKQVRIQQIQLEQDTGKTFIDDMDGEEILVDLNRANAPLMEIVTRPDIESGEEAVMVVRKVQEILKTLDSSPANMDEASVTNGSCVKCDSCRELCAWMSMSLSDLPWMVETKLG